MFQIVLKETDTDYLNYIQDIIDAKVLIEVKVKANFKLGSKVGKIVLIQQII
jgi:hypothetical protein